MTAKIEKGMPLESIPSEDKYDVEIDRERTHWRFSVTPYSEFKRYLNYIFKCLKSRAEILLPYDSALVKAANEIKFDPKTNAFFTRNLNNPVFDTLFGYLKPRTAAEIMELGCGFRQHVYVDGKLYKLSEKEFDQTFANLASHVYKAVTAMDFSNNVINSSVSEDEVNFHERRVEQFGKSIRAFGEMFPASAVSVYRGDGEAILDEMGFDKPGANVCSEKETNYIKKIVAENKLDLEAAIHSLRKYSEMYVLQDLMQELICSKLFQIVII